MGFTLAPVQSGDVSTCAQKQITGTFLSILDFNVAYTYPNSSKWASDIPISKSSVTNNRLKSFCLAVLGNVVLSGSLCVSILA